MPVRGKSQSKPFGLWLHSKVLKRVHKFLPCSFGDSVHFLVARGSKGDFDMMLTCKTLTFLGFDVRIGMDMEGVGFQKIKVNFCSIAYCKCFDGRGIILVCMHRQSAHNMF
jgi:hypothetical protein